MDFPRSCLLWSAAMLLLSGPCSAACGREPGSPPQKAPERPAVRPESQTTPPSAQTPPAKPQPPPVTPKPTPQKPSGRGKDEAKTFAIYTLSRGSGVPPAAREAQQKIQKLVEEDRGRGVSVTAETTRIGIEGEQRLCVTYKNARDAGRALERARAIVKGVDLVNLVVEPCTPPSKTPKKETKP